MGYSLRLAAANSMSVVELYKLLRVNEPDGAAARQEQALAFLGGANPDALLGVFPIKLGRKAGIAFHGHALPLKSMLRWRRPQVCPICVAKTGYCRRVWDLSLSVVCLEHQCLLIDSCPTCKKNLTWTRPSPDWGKCQHYLGRNTKTVDVIPQHLLQHQEVLMDLFRRSRSSSVPSVMNEMQFSLGGWSAWAYAFGICERETGSVNRGAYVSIPTTEKAVELLTRAHARWQLFRSIGSTDREGLKWVVAEPPLIWLMAQSSDPHDRSAGLMIYRSVFGEKALNEVIRRRGVAEQLTLFG